MIDFGPSAREFRDEWLERRPYLKEAALSQPPFAWAELDVVLQQIEPTAPAFQLFKGGLVPEDDFTKRVVEFGTPRRRIDKPRFFDQLRSGATLVINGFERWSPFAARLSASVARLAAAPALGNAYLSLGGRGTFGKHWDTHDVFAFQLIGRKRWQVFAPTFPLPLDVHRNESSDYAGPSTPVLECVLDAGDLLYVPRGWWHHAIPFDEPSLHLSVGTYAPTVRDYLVWACTRYLPGVEGARRSLTDHVDKRALAMILQELCAIVLDDARRAEFARDVERRSRAVVAALEDSASLSITELCAALPQPRSHAIGPAGRGRVHQDVVGG